LLIIIIESITMAYKNGKFSEEALDLFFTDILQLPYDKNQRDQIL